MRMTSEQQLTVTRNDEERRYEVHVGDALGGFTVFRTDDEGRLVFPHTEIDPEFEGRGLGSALVGEALADVARRGEVVVPTCTFVAGYLRKHDVEDLRVDWPASGSGDADADDAGEQPA
jgi:uncharacterized protein